jgi:CheY-like chemotaxis protein
LVEDEELLLELIQSVLESKGYNVLTARDGVAAVEVYKQKKDEIDLVLADLGLPKLGGWEACRQMKAINPKVRVVIASGYLDPSAEQEMIDGGVEAFVNKPYLGGELTEKIRRLLEARS